MTGPNTVQINPMAALDESCALNDYLTNRNKLLAHDNLTLREAVTAQAAEIDRLKGELATAHAEAMAALPEAALPDEYAREP